MRPYSRDLRERILAAVARGEASAFSRMRAWACFNADDFPPAGIASNPVRSSSVSVTMYLFMAALLAASLRLQENRSENRHQDISGGVLGGNSPSGNSPT